MKFRDFVIESRDPTRNRIAIESADHFLEMNSEKIDLEKMASNYIKTNKGMMNRFIDLRNNATNFFDSISSKDFFHKNEVTIIKQIQDNIFLDKISVIIDVPEGFEGNLFRYGQLVNEITTTAFKDSLATLVELSTKLKNFITNASIRSTVMFNDDFMTQRESQMTKEVDRIREYYSKDKPSTISKSTVGDCFANKVEVIESVGLSKKIVDTIKAYDFYVIKDMINEINTLLDEVERGFVTKEYNKDVSKQAMYNLNHAVYVTAKSTEHLVMIMYMAEVYIEVMKKITRIFK